MSSNTREQQRLLIVDDSKVVRVTARKILRDHFETVEAVDGENAWDILAGKEIFSLVISDLNMPGLDGFGLLERIRNSHLPHIRDLPVIIITGANDSEATKKRAALAGATDFIGKPFDSVHLLARTQAHASAHSTARTLREESLALEDESAIDPLTRLANERTFMELGYQQLAYAVRHNTRLSVFHIEIDHYGDLYQALGEDVTESMIQTVATVLTTSIRHEDTAARISTARFALLLPGLNNNGIENLANRIRKSIGERVLKHGDMRTHFTISIGVAATEIRRNTRFDDLITLAKNRLANAIAHGGDRVVYEDIGHPLPRRQPGREMAAAKQAESRGAGASIINDSPVELALIDMDLPAADSRGVPAPASSPGEGMAAGGIVSAYTSAAPAGDSSISPDSPDRLPAADIPGFNTEFLEPGAFTDDESIEITADINPYMPAYGDTAGIDAASGPAKPPTGHTASIQAGKTRRQDSPGQFLAVKTARIGLLERLLAGMFSLFKKA